MNNEKVCPQCGEVKQITDFYRKSRVCKKCALANSKSYSEAHKEQIKEYKRQYYKDNIDRIVEYRKSQNSKAKEREQQRREKLFSLYDEIKTPCAKCGESRLYVVEFHHIDPSEKEHTISQMRNLNLVREEAKKCVCLCANCHAEFHHFYGKHPDDPVGSLEEYLGGRLIATV